MIGGRPGGRRGLGGASPEARTKDLRGTVRRLLARLRREWVRLLVVLFAGALEHMFRAPVATLLARRAAGPPI